MCGWLARLDLKLTCHRQRQPVAYVMQEHMIMRKVITKSLYLFWVHGEGPEIRWRAECRRQSAECLREDAFC